MIDHEPLARLLERWRSGEQMAALAIYQRYEQQLLRLAKRRMRPSLRQRVDPDDIVISVLDSLLVRVGKGQYSSVNSSTSVWYLLHKILNNKIRKQWEFHTAKKRDVQRDVQVEDHKSSADFAAKLASPTPAEAAALADELERIRAILAPEDFQILLFHVDGCSATDILKKLDLSYSRWYITRRLREASQRIREHLQDDLN